MKRAFLLSLLASACLCGCTDESGQVANGGRCMFDDDCRSGFCDNDVCRARSGSGGSIVNGNACTSNEQCVSNNCYEGKVCRAPNWGGSGNLQVGDSCTSASQCASRSCQNGFCISSGTKIVNGQACTSNEQCESSNCYEGKVCRAPNWGGNSKLDVGSVCTDNDSCVSNNCVSGVCNPSGVKDAKTANGKACTRNDQCASSNCYEGKICRTPTWGGTTNKAGNGQSCTSDDQCVSNNCYEGKVCRAPSWGGSQNLGLGDTCTSSDQCASNYCYQNACQNKGGGTVSSSDANKKYCDAIINECHIELYRNYNGCVESMDLLRTVAPKCTKEWDDAYKCIAAQVCDDLELYDRPLSELDKYNTLSVWVPQKCVSLAEKYIECRF